MLSARDSTLNLLSKRETNPVKHVHMYLQSIHVIMVLDLYKSLGGPDGLETFFF